MSDGGAGRAVERLRALVDAESPSGDRERLRVALDLVERWGSAALGRPAQRVTRDGVDHLSWPALRTPATLLVGHVDTVWRAGTTAAWPFTLDPDGDTARGPGVFDMKAGLIATLAAIERLGDTDQVALVVTSDEEVGSITSRPLVEELARTAAAVLVMEPSLDGALKTARCGASFYRLSFAGVEAHAGLDADKGANALIELAHQVLAVGRLADPGLGTLVTPTLAHAGSSMNTVPAAADLHVDVRAYTSAELDRVDARMFALAAADPRVTIAVEGGVNRPPLQRDQSRELFALAQQVAGAEGLAPLAQVAVGGASDGNFTAALGIPTLDGLGPVGGGAHHRSEWVSIASVLDRSALIAGIINAIAAGRVGKELTV